MAEKEKAVPQNGTIPITKGDVTTELTKEATKLVASCANPSSAPDHQPAA